MNPDIEKLLQLPNTWQASRGPQAMQTFSSGHSKLDSALHLGGWPQGATTELLQIRPSSCELQLALPAMTQQQHRASWVVLIDPPFTPFAPALQAQGLELERLLLLYPRDHKELLWAAAQSLQSGSCSSVLTWCHRSTLADKDLRRLQQAAASGQCWHLLMRPLQVLQQASPSALRLKAERQAHGELKLDIIKQRGGWSGQQVILPPAPVRAQTDHSDQSAVNNSTDRFLALRQRPIHLASLPAHPSEQHVIDSLDTEHATHRLQPTRTNTSSRALTGPLRSTPASNIHHLPSKRDSSSFNG